jgi:hypothetical protein
VATGPRRSLEDLFAQLPGLPPEVSG